jgi:hypothetical protein
MNKDINKLYIDQTRDGFVFRIHENHPNFAAVISQYDDYLPGIVTDFEYVRPLWIEFESPYLSVVIDLTKIVGFDTIDITDIF